MDPFISITSLYRTYLREIKKLPTLYLRQFFQLKASDDLHGALRARTAHIREHKIKRVQKDLHKIRAAKPGNSKAFRHVLSLAYGRKGKLKRELMEPILRDSTIPPPPPIIPQIEKSRPPVFSPELKTLLTTSSSRRTKPLSIKALIAPPLLPARADPNSEDARLLGRLSRRREVNIRWRYFTREWKKVYPPLQVVVEGSGASAAAVARVGIRGIGFQGTGVFEEVERIAGVVHPQPPLTRREVQAGKTTGEVQSGHPSRWLRRRYRELLYRLPILTFTPQTGDKSGKRGKYVVSLSAAAASPTIHRSTLRVPEVSSEEDQAWLQLPDTKSSTKEPVNISGNHKRPPSKHPNTTHRRT